MHTCVYSVDKIIFVNKFKGDSYSCLHANLYIVFLLEFIRIALTRHCDLYFMVR